MAPGARSKFGAPMFEPKDFREQKYCIEESTCHCWDFAARGIVPPFAPPSLRPCCQMPSMHCGEMLDCLSSQFVSWTYCSSARERANRSVPCLCSFFYICRRNSTNVRFRSVFFSTSCVLKFATATGRILQLSYASCNSRKH